MYLPGARCEARLVQEGLLEGFAGSGAAHEMEETTPEQELPEETDQIPVEVPDELETAGLLQAAVPPPENDPDTLELMPEAGDEPENWDLPEASPAHAQMPERVVRFREDVVNPIVEPPAPAPVNRSAEGGATARRPAANNRRRGRRALRAASLAHTQCFTCGWLGHFARHCPGPDPQGQICFHCGYRGHRHVACPYPARDEVEAQREAQRRAIQEEERAEEERRERIRQAARPSEDPGTYFPERIEPRGRSRLGRQPTSIRRVGRRP